MEHSIRSSPTFLGGVGRRMPPHLQGRNPIGSVVVGENQTYFLTKCCWEMLRSKVERCSMEDGDKKIEFETHCSYQEMSIIMKIDFLMSGETKSKKTLTTKTSYGQQGAPGNP